MSRRLNKSGFIPGRTHIFLVVGVTFFALLASAGLRAAPGVLLRPLQTDFGWDRSIISLGAAIGIFLYGMVGPFAAALMVQIGIRRTMLGGLLLMAAATFSSLWMHAPWQFIASWGVLSGLGSGAVAAVLGAAIVNRWFATRQGLIMGLLSASTATGSLIFLPFMAWLSRDMAWRPVVLAVSLACMVLVPIVWLAVPERPSDIGVTRFGEKPGYVPASPSRVPSPSLAIDVLLRAGRKPIFWLLFGTFFVCGLTTNGLVGVHMIAFCGDHGVAPVAAAGLMSMMGFFDLFGTTASGLLTDRFNPRLLLIFYYGLRGLSLMALPFLDFNNVNLMAFSVFYGLDWIATVPPTVQLTNKAFGERDAPIVFGWVFSGHQIGAATAAFGAGVIRQETGTYMPAFVGAGAFAVICAIILLVSMLREGRAQGASVSVTQ